MTLQAASFPKDALLLILVFSIDEGYFNLHRFGAIKFSDTGCEHV